MIYPRGDLSQRRSAMCPGNGAGLDWADWERPIRGMSLPWEFPQLFSGASGEPRDPPAAKILLFRVDLQGMGSQEGKPSQGHPRSWDLGGRGEPRCPPAPAGPG